ncbi:CDP-diacylglycerol--glycerol-3-phosphate 3-phosphatidyltransferase [Seminavis robusta]|uniref:CDP-diacylglycerol--glycerol-3-phosphate 3-phosphatidyltransferase n=1 Tax=Seminavis robusta TaxID=568900 RepID=A0A9N8HWX3_9STRA|nr:CDP-diacylglycerol--glycerol-3-phosphate 3-phosphatidyltransferase [Seminavis robusta]|eukprot:Sro2330_g323550.1 CDP-diacylglycerol--glycerol-3-phosphate 3-phosphatidyltransferase (331) ;mRNA; r:1405-2397
MLPSICLITLTFSVVQSTSYSASIVPHSLSGRATRLPTLRYNTPHTRSLPYLSSLTALKGGAVSDSNTDDGDDEEAQQSSFSETTNEEPAVVPPPPTPPSEQISEDPTPPPQQPATDTAVEMAPIITRPPGWIRRTFPNFPYHRLPDYLTLARCAAIPLLCVAFYSPARHIETGVIFALASFTDWLDGFLARRWNVSTAFGAFLDPVADKLMVSTALVLLSGRHGAIVALPAAVVLARELAVSALREWMAQLGHRDTVQVGFQGKVKTALTMVSLTLMLFVPEIGVTTTHSTWLGNLFLPSLACLYLSAVITVTSGSVYFRAAAPFLLQK